MVSKLTKRIEELEVRLLAHNVSEQDIAYKAVLELTGFVRDLSRKIDQLETASA